MIWPLNTYLTQHQLTQPLQNRTSPKSLKLPGHCHTQPPTPNEHTHTSYASYPLCIPCVSYVDLPMTNFSGKSRHIYHVHSSPCKALLPSSGLSEREAVRPTARKPTSWASRPLAPAPPGLCRPQVPHQPRLARTLHVVTIPARDQHPWINVPCNQRASIDLKTSILI